jgi:hypothetical protein
MACASVRRLPSTTIDGSDAAPEGQSTRAESINAPSVRIPTGFNRPAMTKPAAE